MSTSRTRRSIRLAMDLTYSTVVVFADDGERDDVSAKDLNAGSASLKVTAEVRTRAAAPPTKSYSCTFARPAHSVVRPVRELKGFRRVTLAPGAVAEGRVHVGSR